VTASVLERPRRARGTGSIQKNNSGYRWCVWRNGRSETGKTWPTYAEAEDELNRMMADPTFVPVARPQRKGPAKRGPKVNGRVIIPAVPDPDLELPDISDAEIAAAERGATRWGPADASGRRACLPCGGEGIDRRPGPGAGRCCLNCGGEGREITPSPDVAQK